VDVDDAGHPDVPVRRRLALDGQGPVEGDAQEDDDREGSREAQQGEPGPAHAVRGGAAYFLARLRSASALSVRSQVNSGSLRPKWP
jgi:hypothetical protein